MYYIRLSHSQPVRSQPASQPARVEHRSGWLAAAGWPTAPPHRATGYWPQHILAMAAELDRSTDEVLNTALETS